MYYPIDEGKARLSHEMMSMRDYREGEKTLEYRQLVDIAAEMARREKRRKPEYAQVIDSLLDRYAERLAGWMNKESQIGTMCPSVLIAGGDGISAKKKERQNRYMAAHMKKRGEIDRLLDRMRSIGTGGIKAGDAQALVRLEAKLEDLEEAQRMMKEVNAYFRKHKTLEGCMTLTPEQIEKLKASMAGDWRAHPVPYEPWALSNNNAEIHRVRRRIEELSEIKTAGTKEEDAQGIDGLRVMENAELMRIQFIFDGRPDEATRAILKEQGFRWAPSQGAWQRQLNANGKYAAKRALERIRGRSAG